MNGKKVSTLLNEFKAPGYWHIFWDGKSEEGKTVSSGMYLYTIETEEFIKSKKMLFIK